MRPEAGELDEPKLAFFFDEAHLLFNGAPKALVEKVEQVVRLIRSKGVSVWFITQNPSDIPDSVLGQIGNRVQHALRAYTPNDQKALLAAARSFRVNPAFDTEEALQALGVGEALVSVLDEKGVPSIVEKAGILPPRSSMSAAPEAEVKAVIQGSPLAQKYGQVQDRRSAYEVLEEVRQQETAREEEEARQAAWEKEQKAREKELKAQQAAWEKEQRERERMYRQAAAPRRTSTSTRRTTSTRTTSSRKRQDPLEKAISSAANTVGRELGKQIVRGLFGTFRK